MGWCQDKPRSPEQQAEGSQAQRLIFAVAKGNSDIVRSLLAGRINPNVSKKDGTCALHAASSTALQSGTLECATLLLEQGADANQPDRYGNSPLMEAARQPSAEMVELLLAHGATPTATSFQGMTALMRGCVDGCSATSRALLLGRADPQQISPRNGDHALAMAVRGGHIDCVKLLLEFGLTADLRSGNGVTALMVCCTLQQLECAHELVAGRADVNATDDHGTSVLLHTAGHGHEDCVKLLCEHGADVNHKGPADSTALLLAAIRGHRGCAQLLCAFGAGQGEVFDGSSEVETATRAQGHSLLADWLASARCYASPLCHIASLPPYRALEELRTGASIVSCDGVSPSPVDIARALEEEDEAPAGSAAQLVLAAARPWSPSTHSVWPEPHRCWACELLWAGYLLAWRMPSMDALADVWVRFIMPKALPDRSTPPRLYRAQTAALEEP